MVHRIALLLLLVSVSQPALATVLRPGEIGVFYDRAATRRVGLISQFQTYFICARLDAAALGATRFRVELHAENGSIVVLRDVDVRITDAVADANGVVVIDSAMVPVLTPYGYLRIVPYGGTSPYAEMTSAAAGALPRPINWRAPHWRMDLTRTVPMNEPILVYSQEGAVIATQTGADAGDVATLDAYLVYFTVRSGDPDPYDDDFDPGFAGRDIEPWCVPGEYWVCCVCEPHDWVQTRFEWDPAVASLSGVRVGGDQPDALLSVLEEGPGFVVARIDAPGEIHFHDQIFRLDLLLDGTPTMTTVALTSTSSGTNGSGSFAADSPLGSRHPGKVFVDCEFHDVVDDDVIDEFDVRATLDLMLAEEPIGDGALCRADIDFDGELEPGDAVLTAREAEGLPVAPPSGAPGDVQVSSVGSTIRLDTTGVAGFRASLETALPPGTPLVTTSNAGETSARMGADGRIEIVFAQMDMAPATVEVMATEGSLGLPRLVGVTAYDASGNVVAITSSTTSAPGAARAALSVGRAFPNPFNPRVTIPYTAHRPLRMSVRILDAKGRHVLDLGERPVEAGAGSIVWDGRDASGMHVASGVYRVFLVTEEGETVERVTLLK